VVAESCRLFGGRAGIARELPASADGFGGKLRGYGLDQCRGGNPGFLGRVEGHPSTHQGFVARPLRRPRDAVGPGSIMTDIRKAVGTDQKAKRRIAGRIGQRGASIAVFLACEDSRSYITGQTVYRWRPAWAELSQGRWRIRRTG
jgi:hypothetical protein